jgi:hypothetical protein
MKHFLMIALLASLFSGMAFAEDASTDCLMMAESNDRVNTKEIKEAKEKTRSQGTTKQ